MTNEFFLRPQDKLPTWFPIENAMPFVWNALFFLPSGSLLNLDLQNSTVFRAFRKSSQTSQTLLHCFQMLNVSCAITFLHVHFLHKSIKPPTEKHHGLFISVSPTPGMSKASSGWTRDVLVNSSFPKIYVEQLSFLPMCRGSLVSEPLHLWIPLPKLISISTPTCPKAFCQDISSSQSTF